MQLTRQPKIFSLIILMVLILSSLASMGNGPFPAPSLQAGGDFDIEVGQPKSPLCVGESRMLIVTWAPKKGGILAPLSGPMVIYAKTLHGTMDRYTYHPGTISGTTAFYYTATEPGNEVITIQAMNSSLNSDGAGYADFEVKKCDYRFTLYAQLNAFTGSGDVQLDFQYTLKAKGRLTSEGASLAGSYESYNNRLNLETIITNYQFPECALLTWTPGTGSGLVDVKAIPEGANKAMVVRFAPPQELSMNLDMQASCDGEPVTVNRFMDLSSDQDPWIEATFPNGVGSVPVKLDLFEKGVRNLTQAGYQAYYTAVVTLERVEPK